MCSQQKWQIDAQIQKGFIEDLKSWNLIPKTSLAELTSTLMTCSTKKRINGWKQKQQNEGNSIITRPKRQVLNNWETIESDCWRWENTRQTEKVCGPEKKKFSQYWQIQPFSNSPPRKRQDRILNVKKQYFRNYTGGQLVYIDVHPTPSTEKCNRPPEESHYSSNSNRWLHEPCAN